MPDKARVDTESTADIGSGSPADEEHEPATRPNAVATPNENTLDGIVERLASDVAGLDRELAEIDRLVTQARTESPRHEERRAAAAAKLAVASDQVAEPKALAEQNAQLITLTKRAALMESQVDVLEGKRRALVRYREALHAYITAIGSVEHDAGSAGDGAAGPTDGIDQPATGDPARDAPILRMVLTAQEDLRREIARAMHDGPAQSLTNIVLQAQIVERLVERDPSMARGEVRQLVAMVQQTLDATKSFIFDVRPMVLDDLGLTPTLRRATRERGRRAGVPVEFEVVGQDRRLPMDIESGLFRMLDEALAAYLGVGPERITLELEWGDRLEARIVAFRDVKPGPIEAPTFAARGRDGSDLPPALAAMIEDRRADDREAEEAARHGAAATLSGGVWRDIQARATALKMTAALLQDGAELRIAVDLPPRDSPGT